MNRLEALQRELKRRKAVLSFPDFLDYLDPVGSGFIQSSRKSAKICC